MALAAVIWASNDPWKDKPYQQWNSKDLQRIFQDSPWAHIVQVDVSWTQSASGISSGLPAGNPQPVGSGSPMGGYGASSSDSRGNGGAAPRTADPGAANGATATFLVRWISSRTFREALVRDRVLRGQMTDADAQAELAKPAEGFEVAVIGADMTPFQGMDENSLKTSASLSPRHSKTKLTPTAVRIQKSQDGSRIAGILFVFSAKSDSGEAAIGTDEKNVDFSCNIGKFALKSSFETSKMVDNHGRDL